MRPSERCFQPSRAPVAVGWERVTRWAPQHHPAPNVSSPAGVVGPRLDHIVCKALVPGRELDVENPGLGESQHQNPLASSSKAKGLSRPLCHHPISQQEAPKLAENGNAGQPVSI